MTENLVGKVSFVSSQNIYVRFKSSEGRSIGDTLYIAAGDTLAPALMVNSLSSVSCFVQCISDHPVLALDHIIIARISNEKPDSRCSGGAVASVQIGINLLVTDTLNTEARGTKTKSTGDISVNSYSGFSDTDSQVSQRFRYTLSLKAPGIGGSRFSFETHTSFKHKAGEWEYVRDDLFSALKIYNLSIRYDFNKSARITLGRKVNPMISSMGAIDGIQFEIIYGTSRSGFLPDPDQIIRLQS